MEFIEKQTLSIWWLYLVVGITIFPTLAVLIFYKEGLSFDELKKMYFAPILAVCSPFLIIYIIQQSKLTLKIDSEGISYRYFPFKRKFIFFRWITIDKAYIRKYDAFSEYGGFGVKNKLWFKFRDKAYILNDGNNGLQIEFKNGRKLLFSSNKIEELEIFLINLKITQKIQAIQ